MADDRDPGRTAPEVPVWVLGGLAGVLGVAGTTMFLASRPVLGPDALFLIVDAMVAVVYGATSALILSRRRHVIGYLLALTALGGGLSAVGGGWRVLATARGLDPGALATVFGWAWVPGTLALFLVVPWLVRERSLGGTWWGPMIGAAIALTTTLLSLTENFLPFMLALAAAVVWGVVTAAGVEHRRRRSSEPEAIGLDWLALGTLVLALSFLPLLLPVGWLPVWLTPVLHLASQAVFPAAVLSVVLRQRLWGLEVAVSRTVLWGALSVGLGITYLLVSVVLSRAVPGQGWAQTIAAAAVVIAVQPSRLWLGRRVRRLVFGVADPSRVAGRMGSELGRATDPERLLLTLADNVATALRLESVTVRGADGAPVAAAGRATGPELLLPLVAGERPMGTLAVTARPGELLDARTRMALEELCGIVAAALLLRRTGLELTRTRDRLTRARLQERQVIRRELHDGLGPWLAGLRLGLSGAANLVETDPAAAREMLAALQLELGQRIEDVRSAARRLLPPVLEELGLDPALRELVARHAEAGFEVRLSCHLDGEISAPVAAAAYGIASEAVLNAARHSGVSACDLEVSAGPTGVRISCRDHGVGAGDDRPPGVGTRAMRERAEDLGGSLRIQRLVPHGTAVEAVLPLSVDPEELR